jgi:hypothetical protein
MVYVFDTNSFLELQSYYPETFPSFWERFDEMVGQGRINSVAEVQKELEFQASSEHLIEWVERNSHIFTPPSAAEMQHVAEIFRVPHFQHMIGAKQLARGMPVADPFLVARGLDIGGCVVTEEAAKIGSAKIPIVCRHFGVDSCKLQIAMQREGWRF